VSEEYRPSSAEETRDLVAWAAGEETPLEVVGAGSKRSLGRPIEAAHAVSLAGMVGIGLYEPEELVMTARVGTPLAEIEARLAENGQQLAFEPPDYGHLLGVGEAKGTIGGAIACNLAGPRRLKAGAARDHFLGVQAVTGRGDLIRSGGRVVKNVTGYDLCKLLAGSFGTLAVMAEVTVKVLPAGEDTLTVVVPAPDRTSGGRALRDAVASAYDVSGAALLPAPATARSALDAIRTAGRDVAAIRLEGPGPSVRYRADQLKQLLAPQATELAELDAAGSAVLWREIRDVRVLPPDAAAIWRVSVPPAAGPEVAGGLEDALAADWFADWAGGLIWLAVPGGEDGRAAAIRRAIAPTGGHATLVRGEVGLRSRVDVFQPQAEPLARLTARVKESFDPKRILNRGRMYARI